jgi:hypothetical protein
MDITTLFPVCVVIAILCVVILTEIIKKFDKKDRLKGYRVWVPAILSFVMAWLLRIGGFFEPNQVWFWWAVLFAVPVFSYETILKKWQEKISSV